MLRDDPGGARRGQRPGPRRRAGAPELLRGHRGRRRRGGRAHAPRDGGGARSRRRRDRHQDAPVLPARRDRLRPRDPRTPPGHGRGGVVGTRRRGVRDRAPRQGSQRARVPPEGPDRAGRRACPGDPRGAAGRERRGSRDRRTTLGARRIPGGRPRRARHDGPGARVRGDRGRARYDPGGCGRARDDALPTDGRGRRSRDRPARGVQEAARGRRRAIGNGHLPQVLRPGAVRGCAGSRRRRREPARARGHGPVQRHPRVLDDRRAAHRSRDRRDHRTSPRRDGRGDLRARRHDRQVPGRRGDGGLRRPGAVRRIMPSVRCSARWRCRIVSASSTRWDGGPTRSRDSTSGSD